MKVDIPRRRMDTHVSSCADATCQAFLGQVISLVPGIIYIFNQKTNSNEYTNRSIAELLGYSSADLIAMGDMMLAQVVHPDDLLRIQDHFGKVADLADGAYAVLEYRTYDRDGKIVWLRSIDSVFERAADGSVLRHIGIASDITAEREAAARLQRINEQLEARVKARTTDLVALNLKLEARVAQRTAELEGINRDLKELTYVATHDLKVPVNNMTSLTHMLSEAEAVLPDEHVETLGWMRDVCQQASEKVDALICVAQAHSGTLSDFRAVDLATVTEAALVNLHFQVSKARARVLSDFEVPTAWFVPREMENILQSIIGNAIRYSQPGRRPRVTVRSRPCNGGVALSIKDNGSGLDLPRDAEKVFGLFKRAHATPEGAGVSLYAIRRVLERVGGTIEVDSTLGQGSVFTIWLPNRPARS